MDHPIPVDRNTIIGTQVFIPCFPAGRSIPTDTTASGELECIVTGTRRWPEDSHLPGQNLVLWPEEGRITTTWTWACRCRWLGAKLEGGVYNISSKKRGFLHWTLSQVWPERGQKSDWKWAILFVSSIAYMYISSPSPTIHRGTDQSRG